MKNWIIGVAVAIGLALMFVTPVALPIAMFALITSANTAKQQATEATCEEDDSMSVGPAAATVTSDDLDAEQKKNAETEIGVVKARGGTREDAVVTIQVSYQESRLRNLDYGDATSVGLFQQQTGWGSEKNRRNPVYATNKFLDALFEVKNRHKMSPFDVAVAVQNPSRAAYRSPQNNFNGWRALAESIVGDYKANNLDTDSQTIAFDSGCSASESGDGMTEGRAEAFVQHAKTQIGMPYNYAHASEKDGFDCSGLTLWAAKKVGYTLPRIAHQQQRVGKPVTRENLKRGDLVFWGMPAYHVGIYMGDNQLLDAAKPGTKIRIHPMYWENFSGGRRIFSASEQTPGSSAGWQRPIARSSYNLTSKYGMRFHPTLRVWKLHDGTDFGAEGGTPIHAASNGVIEEARMVNGYGNWVVIKHSGNVKTGYAHMRRFAEGIEAGATVKKGQLIGYVGSTGFSTGNHLHLLVWVNDKTTNPVPFFRKQGVPLDSASVA